MADEPLPPHPDWPRYSLWPFPQYRFVPGTGKRRPDPIKYVCGQELSPKVFQPDEWQTNATYLYAVDLFNFAYWWECHEVFEALWHAAGRKSEPGQYLQGLIQVAAANLKRFLGLTHAADNLWRRGLERLQRVPSPYMGLDVLMFGNDVRAYFELARSTPALMRLVFTDKQS